MSRLDKPYAIRMTANIKKGKAIPETFRGGP
jgi:hypothetical protein